MGNPFTNIGDQNQPEENPFSSIGEKENPFQEIDAPGTTSTPSDALNIDPLSVQSPGAETPFGTIGDFGNALVKSLVHKPISLYQELLGNHEKATKTMQEAEKNWPTKHSKLSNLGGVTGSIIPTGVALVGTLAPEPVTSGLGAAVLAHYGFQAAGAGRQGVAQFEQQSGEDVTALQETFVATGYGVTTLAAEYLGLKLLKGIGDKLAPQILNKVGKAFASGDKKGLAQILSNITKAQIKGSAAEGFEEGLEQAMTNTIDNIYKDQPITSDLFDAIGTGAIGGFMLTPVAGGASIIKSRKLMHSQEAENQAIFSPEEQRQGTLLGEVNLEETKQRLKALQAAREADKEQYTVIRDSFKNLKSVQREAIRNADDKPGNVNFTEETFNGQEYTETYNANIAGVDLKFEVNRSKGENITGEYIKMYNEIIDISQPVQTRQDLIDKTTDKVKAEKLFNSVVQINHGIPTDNGKAKLSESVIRDNGNNLLRVYHGQSHSFHFGDPNHIPDAKYGEGIYFTDNAELSLRYNPVALADHTHDPFTLPVQPAFLNIKKPFELDRRYTAEEVLEIRSDLVTDTNGMTGNQIWNTLTSMQPKIEKKDKSKHEIEKQESIIKQTNQLVLQTAGFDGIAYNTGQGDGQHNVIIAFNRGQVVNELKTSEETIKSFTESQPSAPIPPDKIYGVAELNLVLPGDKGGKRTKTKIIPPEATVEPPKILSSLLLEIENRFNQLEIDIKTWNKIVNTPQAMGFKNKFMEWWRVNLMDTALLWSRSHGKAGGRLFQHAVEGFDNYIRLQKIGNVVIGRAESIAKDIEADLGQRELNNVYKRVKNALENRRNADNILKTAAERELFETFQKGYDVYRGEVESAGIATVDDYFTRVARHTSMVEDLFSDVDVLSPSYNSNKQATLNDALAGKVNSKFLKERIGEMRDIETNPLEVFRIYSNSVSRSLGYKNFMNYYLNRFANDIPDINKKDTNFGNMHKELVSWVRGFLSPEHIYGSQSRNVFVSGRNNVYRNLLMFNVRAALDNRTQRDFARAFTSPENWKVADKIFKNRKVIKEQAPKFFSIMEQASKDKAYLLEMTEEDMGFDNPKQGFTRRAYTKLQEIDPFDRAEKGNWDYSEILGIVEQAQKEKSYNRLVKNSNGNELQAIELMLESDIFSRKALVNAQSLSQQTQFMPGVVSSPKLFRNKFLSIMLMLKRFPISQVEQTILSFKTSGSNGSNALRILRRGFENEVQPVEELKKIETFRMAIDEVVSARKKNKGDVNVSLDKLNAFRKEIKAIEDDLNKDVQAIQPINRNNKLNQAGLWAKYSAKRFAMIFMWNYLANILADTIGIGLTEREKEIDPAQRAIESAAQNLVPFVWEARNPDKLIAPPLFPEFNPTEFGTNNFATKKAIRWGFNVVPFAGMIDRLSGRIPSSLLADTISPKKHKSTTVTF